MKAILFSLRQVGQTVTTHLWGAFAPRPYPTLRGPADDAAALRGDWQRVGNDMRSALAKERADRLASMPDALKRPSKLRGQRG